ncbi:MAG: Carboxyvinyl-carboxyphosphonate phosphorylmutase [uncultured Arthrobacter sp.]|uniref:Carboxyvinyl-carboxyphosphonate phosphorylmutase n=1 Tax=uncultured Arthrobacter sp. TaxID=114050 RepID=A0A6J4JFY2_9MICC|nr:isocitrate lyase/phosphoenolpyruvate mutase family protein [uncultured Arthrobacter sp.]CAA9277098.1 MAG: Carboxyvinyl-carboxyphosphonate phosphorylmutase [uncultured Arthrobacter sp.]
MSFFDLHHGASPLILPNAWDVGSALMFRQEGFPAIGTTSFGLAARDGHADARRSVQDSTARLVHQLLNLDCYVSADIEDGFSDSPAAVADYVDRLAAHGINIEDSTGGSLVAPDLHAAKISSIKDRNPGVFVNARIDTYWLGEQATVESTLERAHRYVEAGADGIFVPGVLKPAEITAFTTAIPAPLNVLASTAHTSTWLGEMGVRRISTGSLPYRAALDAALRVATDVRDGRPATRATPYDAVQRMLGEFERTTRH